VIFISPSTGGQPDPNATSKNAPINKKYDDYVNQFKPAQALIKGSP
jgi:hypothetical protein